MSKGRLVIINMIGIIALLTLIAVCGYYYYQNQHYVTTDEAEVSANMTKITAPASGKLSGWSAKEGDHISDGDKLGEISDGQQSVSVKALSDGTLVKHAAVNHQIVNAGDVIGQTADMDDLYITANIKETELHDIEKGDKVEITVDGDPDATFEGKVEEIGYVTNSVFSMLPQINTSGDYTKVTEKVQVKISIQNPSAKVLPGMNAEVKITL
ncbi:HlyD family secretion protein [Bacillus sp. NSP9.1]|uniref:HlyD family secretion protein n=1 Tax=Bacillus sp. NSP9.1 TaxID=1071078 RepID=UPI0003FA9CC4|nr:HlyD family efflux transporter periplasmic adaptor subunit [Bacillus sp. NSP9.1]QHZ48053.1 HlyD family secretion protein [Bacillus sp. NSP9.1]